jgi:hypothetical protein
VQRLFSSNRRLCTWHRVTLHVLERHLMQALHPQIPRWHSAMLTGPRCAVGRRFLPGLIGEGVFVMMSRDTSLNPMLLIASHAIVVNMSCYYYVWPFPASCFLKQLIESKCMLIFRTVLTAFYCMQKYGLKYHDALNVLASLLLRIGSK